MQCTTLCGRYHETQNVHTKQTSLLARMIIIQRVVGCEYTCYCCYRRCKIAVELSSESQHDCCYPEDDGPKFRKAASKLIYGHQGTTLQRLTNFIFPTH